MIRKILNDTISETLSEAPLKSNMCPSLAHNCRKRVTHSLYVTTKHRCPHRKSVLRNKKTTGNREEDSARTEPRIRLRAGSGTTHRKWGSRFSPVAVGHHSGPGPRLIRPLKLEGPGGSLHLAIVFSTPKNHQNRDQKRIWGSLCYDCMWCIKFIGICFVSLNIFAGTYKTAGSWISVPKLLSFLSFLSW